MTIPGNHVSSGSTITVLLRVKSYHPDWQTATQEISVGDDKQPTLEIT